MARTASNSSRVTTSMDWSRRSIWALTAASASRRKPCAAPAASVISLARSSKRRLDVWVMGIPLEIGHARAVSVQQTGGQSHGYVPAADQYAALTRPHASAMAAPMTTFAIPFPMIDPVLISIGPFAIRWYALSYIVGLVGGWLYAKWLASRPSLWLKPPPPAAVEDLLVYVAVGIILGGRIGYVLFYNFAEYLKSPLDAFAIWKGGMSFHGGLAGGALAVFLLARRHATSALGMFDLAC